MLNLKINIAGILCAAALLHPAAFAQSKTTSKPSQATTNYIQALRAANFDLADQFLNDGADINCDGCAGDPVLFLEWVGVSSKSPTRWLLERKANPNLFSKSLGQTAFQWWIYTVVVPDIGRGSPISSLTTQYFIDMMDAYTRAGADFRLPDKAGNTVLHYLGRGAGYYSYPYWNAKQNFIFAMEAFIENGVDINQANRIGVTPLMHAAGTCNMPAIEYFIAKGARTELKSKDQKQAWEYANTKALEGNKSCNEVIGYLKPT